MYKLLLILLLVSPVYGEELTCTQTPTEVYCIVNDEEMLLQEFKDETWSLWPKPKAAPAIVVPIVRLLVIEVAKSVTVDIIKEAILAKFKQEFPSKPVPTKILLQKAH